MNVLSLFDGISCGQEALNRIGFKVNKYFSSEIDKYAIKITQKNYPNTVQIGDVSKVDYNSRNLIWDGGYSSWEGKIDLLIGGSPCQGFSLAGKRLNFDDPRSKLFFEYVRLLNIIKPKYFLLENVRMKKEYQDIISQHLEVEPVKINSALVSAQNRNRLYWTNIKYVRQPKDKNLYLSDILMDRNKCEDITDRIFSKNPSTLAYQYALKFVRKPNQKSRVLMAGGQNISNQGATNILVNDRYYKLHPIECERLQTLPDNYTEGISKSQRYKCLGNGWTVDVIAHIFKYMSF